MIPKQLFIYCALLLLLASERQHHKKHAMQFARRKTKQTKNCSIVDTFLCSTAYLYACSFLAVNSTQNNKLTIPFYLCIHILTTCFSETQQLFVWNFIAEERVMQWVNNVIARVFIYFSLYKPLYSM